MSFVRKLLRIETIPTLEYNKYKDGGRNGGLIHGILNSC